MFSGWQLAGFLLTCMAVFFILNLFNLLKTSRSRKKRGEVYADNTEFGDELFVSAIRSIFKSSTTKDIVDTYKGLKMRNIYLQAKTTVNGSITFKYGVADRNIVHIEASTITGMACDPGLLFVSFPAKCHTGRDPDSSLIESMD